MPHKQELSDKNMSGGCALVAGVKVKDKQSFKQNDTLFPVKLSVDEKKKKKADRYRDDF